jgi:hypothetical protein
MDLLQTIAYHVRPARWRALSVLASYWPRALGHFTVSKPFPALGSHASSFASRSYPDASNHLYAHQFVPWRFSNRAKPGLFDGSSKDDCRVCFQPVRDFGLFCPFCMCAVHYDCYDYPEGNLVLQYKIKKDERKQKVAVYRFSYILPMRHTMIEKALTHLGHSFRPVNLFSLTLCFFCRMPLWGCWEQALKCDLCNCFTHSTCASNRDSHSDSCGASVLSSEHITISWDNLRSTFRNYYAECLEGDIEQGLRYEEISIVSDMFAVQKSILKNGLALGSIVVEEHDSLPSFEIDTALQELYGALSSSPVHLSTTISDFLLENEIHYTEHSMLYDWSTIIFIASSIRAPSNDAMASHESSSSYLVAPSFATNQADTTFNPFEVITIAHLRDALGSTFQVYSDAAARVLLSHLRHVGFYDRLDANTVSHESFSYPEKIMCLFPLPLGLDMSVDVEILVAAVESSLSDINLSVNEAGFLLLIRRFWPNQMATGYALQRLAQAVISWVMNEVICF